MKKKHILIFDTFSVYFLKRKFLRMDRLLLLDSKMELCTRWILYKMDLNKQKSYRIRLNACRGG